MSKDTDINVFCWQNEDNFTSKLKKTVEIFKSEIKYELKKGFWEEEEVPIENQIYNTLINSTRRGDPSLYYFCNHDGETDGAVFRCIYRFAEILAYLCSDSLVIVRTELNERKKQYIFSHIYGCSVTKDQTAVWDREMEYMLANYKKKKCFEDIERYDKIIKSRKKRIYRKKFEEIDIEELIR